MKRRSKVIIRGIGWSAELRPLPFGAGYVSGEWRLIIGGSRHRWVAWHWPMGPKSQGPTLRAAVTAAVEQLTATEVTPVVSSDKSYPLHWPEESTEHGRSHKHE